MDKNKSHLSFESQKQFYIVQNFSRFKGLFWNTIKISISQRASLALSIKKEKHRCAEQPYSFVLLNARCFLIFIFLNEFNHRCHALAAANAQCGNAILLAAAHHFMKQCDDDSRSCRTERMAKRNAAAVDVHFFRV